MVDVSWSSPTFPLLVLRLVCLPGYPDISWSLMVPSSLLVLGLSLLESSKSDVAWWSTSLSLLVCLLGNLRGEVSCWSTSSLLVCLLG